MKVQRKSISRKGAGSIEPVSSDPVTLVYEAKRPGGSSFSEIRLAENDETENPQVNVYEGKQLVSEIVNAEDSGSGHRYTRREAPVSSQMNLRQQFKTGIWNVRTLNAHGSVELLVKEAKRLSLDLLGLAETRILGKGKQDLSAGWTLLLSGPDRIKAQGVGVLLGKNASRALIGCSTVSDRIMTVRLAAHPVNLTWIQVYAHTNQANDVISGEFYDRLQETLEQVPAKT